MKKVAEKSVLGAYTITAQSVGGNPRNFLPSGSGNIEIGDSQKEVAKFQLTETSQREDLLFERITIYIEGSIRLEDLVNWKLYASDGKILVESVSVKGRFISFVFANSYRIPKGAARLFSVKVDVMDGADHFFRLHIQNSDDVLITGAKSEKFIEPSSFTDQAASDGFWRIKEGFLAVNLTADSPLEEIEAGAQDVVLAKFNLHATGEGLEIRKMGLEIVENSQLVTDQLTGKVRVQSEDGSITYLSVLADSPDLQRIFDTPQSKRYGLNNYIAIPPGESKTIKIVATAREHVSPSQTYRIKVGNFSVWKSSRSSVDLFTSSYISGNALGVMVKSPLQKEIERRARDGKMIANYIENYHKRNVGLPSRQGGHSLQLIHLITNSIEPENAIFLVLDERFEMPIRYEIKNSKGQPSYIKKLYDIAYPWNVPNKRVDYTRSLADSINNGLFRVKEVKKYMKSNTLEKPTLVQKSTEGTLVLKNEVQVKTGLVNNDVPSQHVYLYIDKTK